MKLLWLHVGRGSRRGLCWLHGLHMERVKCDKVEWLKLLAADSAKLDKALTAKHWPPLGDIGNGAHFLCELDKRFRSTVACDERRAWGAEPYSRYRGR